MTIDQKTIIKNEKHFSKERGFTLLEILIAIFIFGILTAVVVFNYNSFQSGVLLNNMAYELALTVRQAQTYGIGVRGIGLDFNSPYGSYIDLQNPGEIKLFFDKNSNGICDDNAGNQCDCVGPDDECLEKTTMQKKIAFYRICYMAGTDTSFTCDLSYKKASFTFIRPNLSAKLMVSDNTDWLESITGKGPITNLKIELQTPDSSIKRAVRVSNLGQVTVENVEI